MAARVAELSTEAQSRVLAVEVRTRIGRRFRSVVLRALRVQALAYGVLAHYLTRKQSIARAFDRWGTRTEAMRRWFVVQLGSIIAAAPPDERRSLAIALSAP